MKLHHFEDVSKFYDRVKNYLLQHEAVNILPLGICSQLMSNPKHFSEPPYLATVEAENTLLAVALRTPAMALVLSHCVDIQALTEIAQDLHFRKELIPGVTALKEEASAFAEVWKNITGQSYHLSLGLLIHQLENVQFIPKTNGHFRQATISDRDLLIQWCLGFNLEIMESTDKPAIVQSLDRRLRDGSLYLWEDNIPVSMAAYTGKTPNGIRINLVYTPLEHRQKGYATSCVAALSQTLLDRGNKYCFLFTDKTNPTANHIYQKIGYQVVGEASSYTFVHC